MTPDAINRAVATAQGFTDIYDNEEWHEDGDSDGFVIVQRGQQNGRDRCVPKYTSDLNACAEFEATLTGSERETYKYRLVDVCSGPRTGNGEAIFATAAQRCEAYLRVKSLWPTDARPGHQSQRNEGEA
jgi:hypothetical protein